MTKLKILGEITQNCDVPDFANFAFKKIWGIRKIKFTSKDDVNITDADQVMNLIAENFFNEPYSRKQLRKMSDKTSDDNKTELTSERRRRDAGVSDFKQHRGTVIRITCYKFVRWYVSKLKILEYTVYVIRLHAEERCFGRRNKHRVWEKKQDGSVIDVTHKKKQWREDNANENADQIDRTTTGPVTSRRRRETQTANPPETCADTETCWLRHPDIVVDSSDIYFDQEVCEEYLIPNTF